MNFKKETTIAHLNFLKGLFVGVEYEVSDREIQESIVRIILDERGWPEDTIDYWINRYKDQRP